jgi:hypothetical protein
VEKYKDLNGNSGISAFEIGRDYIMIEFKDGGRYLYNYSQPGIREVEEMKKYTLKGRELATYINQNVRERYAAKLK